LGTPYSKPNSVQRTAGLRSLKRKETHKIERKGKEKRRKGDQKKRR